jgi:hypothetical protein
MKITTLLMSVALVASLCVTSSAAVTIGGLSYSIVSVTRASTFGPEFMQERASGEYIVVRLTIKNVGKEPATITGSDFHLERGDTKFDAASVTVGAADGFFLAKLNPGVSRTGIIVFDVPAHTAPSKYHLIVYGNGSSDHTNLQLR